MRTLLDRIIHEAALEETALEGFDELIDSEESFASEELEAIDREDGLVTCRGNMSSKSAWPRCNPLLLGLVKLKRDTSPSYKAWVRTAWETVQRAFPRKIDMELKVGTGFNEIKSAIESLKAGKWYPGWEKVEARLLIPFGLGGSPSGWPGQTLPPGISTTPKAGRYLRTTNALSESLKKYAALAYGPSKAEMGARAIDNFPYNRRYWIYGPPTGAFRIDRKRGFECDLVKLHQVSAFHSPAPKGSCYPVLFLPFEHEIDKWA